MQRVHGDPPLTLVLYIKLYTITPHTKNKTIAIGLFSACKRLLMIYIYAGVSGFLSFAGKRKHCIINISYS